jgi:hypothetical protein
MYINFNLAGEQCMIRAVQSVHYPAAVHYSARQVNDTYKYYSEILCRSCSALRFFIVYVACSRDDVDKFMLPLDHKCFCQAFLQKKKI